ncbi:uncharacterized protein LOC115739209 isoform X2 [Rhodamnia argentea]|uniref:Uncharacterized protein LOC115739209 isoform X2 n=1 Tax=Rhodamnia argentea TaxID=178133 RepID=A0A8B8NZT5_9MYRT|nr:uncharacterized protein LOC115739209 isoform X2 [Rhodamnia argentea]
MGWKHPEVSLGEMVNLVKGFADILILASGYQSSGLLAHWDQQNVTKAFQWGFFFEQVFKSFRCSEDSDESLQELDKALSVIVADASFPQGLAKLSSGTLSRARDIVLEQLVHCLPLRDSNLGALLCSTIQMDLDVLSREDPDCLSRYLDKLNLQNTSHDSLHDGGSSEKFSPINHADIANNETEERAKQNGTNSCIQELLKRQSAVSCALSAEKSLAVISRAVGSSQLTWGDQSIDREHLMHDGASRNKDQLDEVTIWYRWKTRSLAYFIDKRTIRLVSGASMMFAASPMQWAQVFERLKMSEGRNIGSLSDKIELLLLGCVTRRWSLVIKHLQSVYHDSFTSSQRFSEVCNLLSGRSQNLILKESMAHSKEGSILDYLMNLLDGQVRLLWMVPPALSAVAIPSWSPLFRFYVNQIKIQLKEGSPMLRCCSCTQEKKEHKDCELAERIWCLHIFHIRGPQLWLGGNDE